MYQTLIAEILTERGTSRFYDPRHIEGYMRLQYSTLDHLTYGDFLREVKLCCMCINEGGIEAAETNAKSYGL